MFKISPVQDKKTAKEFAKLCGTEYKEDAFVYSMIDQDSGELMAISQFELLADCGYIHSISHSSLGFDYEAMFILGRQTMCFIESCGITTCRIAKDAADTSLIKAIGFKEDGDGYSCDLTGMFDANCGHH